MGVIEGACVCVPGDIADGNGTQIARAVIIEENLTNKAELAGADLECAHQQFVERFALVVCVDVSRLHLSDQRQQLARIFCLLIPLLQVGVVSAYDLQAAVPGGLQQ